MKKILVSLLSAVLLMGVCSFVGAADDAKVSKIVVYYFHGNFRCLTCTNMEKFAREAIEANFKDALQSGALQFKEVNIEKKENEHFAKEYQLYTKALIFSSVKDGLEVKSENLDKIWEYAHNKPKFMAYVTQELEQFMKDAQ